MPRRNVDKMPTEIPLRKLIFTVLVLTILNRHLGFRRWNIWPSQFSPIPQTSLIPANRYQKLPQNFGGKYVLTYQDHSKCICYKHIGELTQKLLNFNGVEIDSVELSDFIGKLKTGKICNHAAVLKHPCVTHANLDLEKDSDNAERFIKTGKSEAKLCPKISDSDTDKRVK